MSDPDAVATMRKVAEQCEELAKKPSDRVWPKIQAQTPSPTSGRSGALRKPTDARRASDGSLPSPSSGGAPDARLAKSCRQSRPGGRGPRRSPLLPALRRRPRTVYGNEAVEAKLAAQREWPIGGEGRRERCRLPLG
jgi:hypothetical protein